MGSCITKPSFPDRLPLDSGPSIRVEEEAVEPFRVSLVEEGSEPSEEDNSEDSDVRYSLSSAFRDSMEILRAAVCKKEWLSAMHATLEEQEVEINQLKEEIAVLKTAPPRDPVCFLCRKERPKVLFEPCHHLSCCNTCALQVSHCPVCSQPIEQQEEVFLSM
jgi:hypothetical protein